MSKHAQPWVQWAIYTTLTGRETRLRGPCSVPVVQAARTADEAVSRYRGSAMRCPWPEGALVARRAP